MAHLLQTEPHAPLSDSFRVLLPCAVVISVQSLYQR